MIDRFGRQIIKTNNNGIATYQCEGLLIEGGTDEDALNTLNAMAPMGWVDSVEI